MERNCSFEGTKLYCVRFLLRKEQNITQRAFFYCFSIRNEKQTMQLFLLFICAEHKFNWKPSLAFLRASEHSCLPQNTSLYMPHRFVLRTSYLPTHLTLPYVPNVIASNLSNIHAVMLYFGKKFLCISPTHVRKVKDMI